MNSALLPPSSHYIFYIWSFEHSAWWRPFFGGYTNNLEDAGIYNLADAQSIVNDANIIAKDGSVVINEEIRYLRKNQDPKTETPARLDGEILEFLKYNIPEEFWSVLSAIAYNDGHSAGEKEVLMILHNLCFNLSSSFEKFRLNIINNTNHSQV